MARLSASQLASRARRASRLLLRWIDALLPRACAGCGVTIAEESALCGACAAALPAVPQGACPHCQLHPAAAPQRCPRRDARDPLVANLAAHWLEAPVSDWVHHFKYPARSIAGLHPAPAAALGELLARSAARAPGGSPDLIVPVPLHPARLRGRGFNPAALLARSLARSLGVACDPVALVRERDTPTQTGLDLRARRRNLHACMRAHRHCPARVWLVDDVLTTGATAREAARALRCAGAREVVALAAARTPWID